MEKCPRCQQEYNEGPPGLEGDCLCRKPYPIPEPSQPPPPDPTPAPGVWISKEEQAAINEKAKYIPELSRVADLESRLREAEEKYEAAVNKYGECSQKYLECAGKLAAAQEENRKLRGPLDDQR
jgi:hypothetical protein